MHDNTRDTLYVINDNEGRGDAGTVSSTILIFGERDG